MSSSEGFKKPAIPIVTIYEGEEMVPLATPVDTSANNSPKIQHLEIPMSLNAYPRHRQSVISRNSIEMFLNSFPKNESDFRQRELRNTITDILSTDIGLNNQMNTIEKIRKILDSQKFNLFQITLVVMDVICVIIQVVLDIVMKEHHEHYLHIAEEVVEIISAVILLTFILISFAKIIFIPKKFFKSKLEIFDTVIVIISFSLEIVSIVKKDQVREVEALAILFRFWRVIRIVNAIVVTVEKRLYEKLESLKEDIKNVLEENTSMETAINKKTSEIAKLNNDLKNRTNDCLEIRAKFENFITQSQKVRLKEKLNDIGELKAKLAQSNSDNVRMNNENKELKRKIEELQAVIIKKDEENSKLNSLILKAVENSVNLKIIQDINVDKN